MPKIDRVDELPDWFALDKYEDTKKYDAVDWYRALFSRQFALSIVGDTGALSKYYESTITRIREAPALIGAELTTADQAGAEIRIRRENNFTTMTYFDLHHLRREAGTVDEMNAWVQTVASELDCLDSQEAISELYQLNPYLEAWNGVLHGLTEENLHLLKTTRVVKNSYPDGTLTPSTHVAAFVNLSAPDVVLKKAFSDWLAETRKHHNIDPGPKLIYTRWARYAILPYLDLKIWALETSTTIPDRVMAAAVMPRHDDGIDNLRKTTKPLARELMASLAQLQALAATEAAGMETSSE